MLIETQVLLPWPYYYINIIIIIIIIIIMCVKHQVVLTETQIFFKFCFLPYTVKPAHAVTSIKQSPVLKGHHFLVLS
jgi:hypothetical protein